MNESRLDSASHAAHTLETETASQGFFADAYHGLKNAIQEHPKTAIALTGAGIVLAVGALYLSRGKAASLVDTAESTVVSVGRMSGRGAEAIEVGIGLGARPIEAGVGLLGRSLDTGAAAGLGTTELRATASTASALDLQAGVSFSRIEPVGSVITASGESGITFTESASSTLGDLRISLVGSPQPPAISKMFNPTAEDFEALRRLDTIGCQRYFDYPRQFLVVKGDPGRWHDATLAGDKRVQSLFTGREMFHRGQELSVLGPERRILLQHFNGITEPLNTKLAGEADLLMCCYPERLSASFRARHVLPDLQGKLGVSMLTEPVAELPSGRALTINLYRVPTLRQLTYSRPG